MKAPRHLLSAWREIRRKLARARHVALLTDFDGTLAGIRPRPDQVWLERGAQRLLAGLAQRGAVVAVVSGRKLEDVRERVGLSGIWYVGAHGYFLRAPNNRVIGLLNPIEQARIRRARRVLSKRLRRLPGILLEAKRATIAVHYRAASASDAEAARGIVEEFLAKNPGLWLLAGKKVWELLPKSRRRIDKWAAVQTILRQERGGKLQGSRVVFYLGDDTTDERVFENLHGVSVAIAKRRNTAARFYLRSPGEVRKFLERLNQVLS